MKTILQYLIIGLFLFFSLEGFGQCPSADMNVSGTNSGCEGQSITVDNNTTNPTQVDSFIWRWNNDVDYGYPDTFITVFNMNSQTHTYVIPDAAVSNNCNTTSLEFEIELEVYDQCNVNLSSNSSPIFIYIKPRPLFTTFTPVVCLGESISFSNSTCPSVSPGISYEWDFGDASPNSTQSNPSHTYTTSGTYTVTLTATNDDAAVICGTLSDTYQMQVTVLDAPQPQYTLSATSLNSTQDTICAGNSLTISSQSLNTDSINIDISPNNGFTLTSGNDYTNPTSINFTNDGLYTITLKTYQCNGANPCNQQNIICDEEVTFDIYVLPSSGATLDVDDCINNFIVDFNPDFQYTGTPPSGVVWNFLDINENTTHPSQTGVNPSSVDYTTNGFGTYIVEVIYPDACNNQTLRDTFIIGELATFAPIPDYCEGSNVQINLDDLILTPANSDFDWSGNGVYIGNNGDDSLDISGLSVGSHTVTYMDSSGCNSTDDLTFNILDGATISLNTFPNCFTDTIFNVNSFVVPPFGTYDTVYWEVYHLPNITTPAFTYDTLYPGNIQVQLDSTLIKVTLVSQCGTSTDSGYIYVPDILVLDTLLSQCSNVDTCINLDDLILSPTGLCLTWSGNGVSGNCFNPSQANVGFNTISYVGCTDACYSNSFVVEVTDGSSNLQDDQICVSSSPIILDDLQDGIWSSNGNVNGIVNDVLFPNIMGSGIFEVYYQSDSGSLCLIQDTFEITIDSSVTALVGVNAPNCVDSIFIFQNLSIHNVINWSDGSSGNTTMVTYPSANTYNEWLVVGNTTCNDTSFFDVVVEPLITGDISIDNLNIGCFGATIDLSVANPDDSYSYFWEVDGNTSTIENPSFFINGNIIDTLVHINLTITNTCGTLMLQDTVLVPAIFNAGFGALQTDTICHGELITFANISTGFIDSYTIYYGNGDSSVNTMIDQIYYNNTDSIIHYQLMMVIYSNLCGTDTAYQNIYVLPSEIEAGGWIDGFSGCEPLERQFICYSTPGTVSTFFFGNGSSATGFSPEDTLYYTYQNSGIYYPYVVAVGCGIDTFYFNPVTVNELPDLGFFHQLEACVGETVIFTDTSNLASNLQWFIDGILVQSIDDLVHTFDNAGTYEVCMQGTHILTQCSHTVCSQITIVDNPNSFSGITISPTIGCNPLEVTVDVTIPFDSLRIDYGNGQVRYNSSTVLYDSVGEYTLKIRLFNASDCFIDTTVLIQVRPAISVVAYANPYEITLGENTEISVVSDVDIINTIWTLPDSSTLTNLQNFEDEPTIIGINNYHVFVEAEHGCFGEDTVQVKVFDERNIYIPNAFTPNTDGRNDEFQIYTGKGVVEIQTFIIHDRFGNRVFEATNFLPNDTNASWDGTHRGEELTPQVFVYYAEVLFSDGKVVSYKGDVTLVR
ncbi:MAG: PKD domain-containing protein [Saprospiraceae bacterium]